MNFYKNNKKEFYLNLKQNLNVKLLSAWHKTYMYKDKRK